jgi:hypothetical protein
MKKHTFFFNVMVLLMVLLWEALTAAQAGAQTAHDATVDALVLFPGDARSIELEYDDTLGNPDSYHVALIAAMAPDQEIHQLTINLSPRGDVGPEIGYFSWGIFFSFTGGIFDFIEVLDPKFTYGFNSVNYIVDVNPYVSLGLLFSAATTKFSHFDFPLEMTMTLTLSN